MYFEFPVVTLLCIVLSAIQYFRFWLLKKKEFVPQAALKVGAMQKEAFKNGETWRLVSAAFVHFSLYHLLLNCYSLWQLGSIMEPYMQPQFVILFFGAVICGNLMTVKFGHPQMVSGGLSGGIYGLMTCVFLRLVRWQGLSLLSSSEALSVIFINLIMNFMPNICWQAHLGGALWGAAYTVINWLLIRLF
jgi:rhomboid protease GluP